MPLQRDIMMGGVQIVHASDDFPAAAMNWLGDVNAHSIPFRVAACACEAVIVRSFAQSIYAGTT